MTTLTDFLLARIAEDEQEAQRLLADLSAQITAEGLGPDERGPYTPARLLKAVLWAQYDGQSRWRNFARGQQIANLANPARVLAECEAKRAIVQMLTVRDEQDHPAVTAHATGLRLAVKALSAVYADHPDYDPTWAA